MDEAATAALQGPVAQTKALAFVFAYLTAAAEDEAFLAELRRRDPKAYFAEPQRRAFTELWDELARPLTGTDAIDVGRRQTIENLAGYVFRMFGRVR